MPWREEVGALLADAAQALIARQDRQVITKLGTALAYLEKAELTSQPGARELLAKVREMAPDVPGFGGAVAALKGAIQHHVEDEESEAFPKLRKEMRDRIPKAPPGSGTTDGLSRDELYEKAKELDITGRSNMSKDDLQHAVETAQSVRSRS